MHGEGQRKSSLWDMLRPQKPAALAPLKIENALRPECRAGKELWGYVKNMMWRLINPSLAFAHTVRRALFTERMAQVLLKMSAFESCDISELYQMVSSGCEIFLARYKVLYREGGFAQTMYILLEGTVEHKALVGEVSEALRLQTCTDDGSDGMHGLPVGQETLTKVSRMTTAYAVTNCRLLQFSATNLGLSATKVMREFVRGELKAVPLFDGITSDIFEKVVPLMDCFEIDMVGKDIVTEGQVPSHLCILVHGSVNIVLKSGICIAKLMAHAPETYNSYPFFGEMGMLANKPAAASVRVSSAVKVITVSRSNFARFLNLVPDFEQRINEIAKLRQMHLSILDAQKRAQEEQSKALYNESASRVLSDPRMKKRASQLDTRAKIEQLKQERNQENEGRSLKRRSLSKAPEPAEQPESFRKVVARASLVPAATAILEQIRRNRRGKVDSPVVAAAV